MPNLTKQPMRCFETAVRFLEDIEDYGYDGAIIYDKYRSVNKLKKGDLVWAQTNNHGEKAVIVVSQSRRVLHVRLNCRLFTFLQSGSKIYI